MKSAGIKDVDGARLEEYHKTVMATDKSRRKLRPVLVFVVPEGEQWEKVIKIEKARECWLKGASPEFMKECDVVVIEFRFE